MLSNDFNVIAPWVAKHAHCTIPNRASALGVVKQGKVVAGVIYEAFTGASVTATIGIAPGVNAGKEFFKCIFDYPFNQLKVSKIFIMVASTNKESLKFVGRIGFHEVAVLGGYYEGADGIILECTKDTCPWIGEDNG